jgi:membrane protein required for colicin V production
LDLILDLCILVLVFIGAVHGFRKGLILQVMVMAGVVVAIWGASAFSGSLEPRLVAWVVPYGAVAVVSVVLVFLLILAGVMLPAYFLHFVCHLTPLGLINRFLGAFTGIATALIALSVLLALARKMDTYIPVIPGKVVASSRLFDPVSKIVPTVFPHLEFEKLQLWLERVRSKH